MTLDKEPKESFEPIVTDNYPLAKSYIQTQTWYIIYKKQLKMGHEHKYKIQIYTLYKINTGENICTTIINNKKNQCYIVLKTSVLWKTLLENESPRHGQGESAWTQGPITTCGCGLKSWKDALARLVANKTTVRCSTYLSLWCCKWSLHRVLSTALLKDWSLKHPKH